MIVVTGASGRLGRRVVQLLVDQNRAVLATDRSATDDLPAEFVRCDLEDAKAVEGILKGAEAVVHLGAIPGPLREDPRVIFENNVASAFNVMMSAAELGLRRVVFSSSAFGMGWAHDGNAFVPLYLPLDEEHPMMPFEPYGLSAKAAAALTLSPTPNWLNDNTPVLTFAPHRSQGKVDAVPALLAGVFHREVGRNEGKDALGIPHWNGAGDHPDLTASRIKIGRRPDARVGGQWRRDPGLRLDVVGRHRKVQV